MEGSNMGKEDRYNLKNNPISDLKIGLDTHSFNVSLASRFGLIEALVIQHAYYWYKCNKGNEDMTKDGHTWFYRSVSQIADVYPYLSVDKVRRAIDRLVENGILIKGNYNTDKFKKANWYSLSDDMISVMSGDNEGDDRQNAKPFGKMPNHSAKCQLNYNKEDNSKEYKEEIDKSISKKDVNLPFTAEPTAEYEKPKKKRNVTPKDDALFEECWIAYNRRGNKAKAKVYWDKINEEERKNILPHIKAYVQSRDRQYQSYFERYLRDKGFNDVVYKGNSILYDPERYKEGNNIYMPYTEGYHLWLNENDGKYYFTGNIINLADGYTKDNRPNGAQVHQNGYTYTWNATSKEWERG